MSSHCHVCSLRNTHPGVKVYEDGECNLCKLEVPEGLTDNCSYSQENYDEFLQSKPKLSVKYDCLFMYSGGKDSTYMLDRFVNEEKRRVLAYTFNVPFYSDSTAENIQIIRSKIKTDYKIDQDDAKIIKLMRHLFNHHQPNGKGKYLDEKLPCMSCRDFFVLRALVFAYRQGIPYIVFCADPQQIITIETNIKKIIKSFYARAGRELTAELFGEDLEDLLFADDETLPKIIFPFIGIRHSYDPEKIVAEIKQKGLYISSPLETHCTLFPLLNFYSFKHYNCSFYKLNMSSRAREIARNPQNKRSTFGITFNDGNNMLETEERFKQLVFELASGVNTNQDQDKRLLAVFSDMGFDNNVATYLTEQFLSMRHISDKLGIKLIQ